MRRGLLGAILLALICLMPATAQANIGVPMLAIYLPPAWLLLLPIILIEAAHGTLRWGVPFRGALKTLALANVVSTIVGVPLSWAMAAGVELICCGEAIGLGTVGQRVYAVTVQAPWLIPYETDLWWMVPAATAVLTLLFCGMSILVEYPIVRRGVPGLVASDARQWVVRTNVITYSLLLLFITVLGQHEGLAKAINDAFSCVTWPIVNAVFAGLRRLLGVA